jgi:hypothetical protein
MSDANHAPSSVVHMLVDTSVWLDLVKQPGGGKLIAVLRELCEEGKLELLVPQIVLDEFERNRDRVKESMTRSVSEKFREVRKAIEEHGHGDGMKKALEELDNITHQVPLVSELATRTFDALVELLRSGKTLSPTPELKERVVERALAKRAPFHRERNSVADAMLIEMYGEASKHASEVDLYCFATHNTKDFSSADGDTRHPHEDFTAFFSAPHSRYFNNIQTALVVNMPTEMEELSFEYDYQEDPRALSEVLTYLNKLEDQIWYNRHKNLEYRIKTGEHKLVDRWQRKNAQTTTVRSVWQSAQKSARKLEAIHGAKELGPWDDFEWGMLSGKMSAIRWMLGEDWESTLDT